MQLASYERGQVALPWGQSPPMQPEDLLDSKASNIVRNFDSEVMFSSSEWNSMEGTMASATPYMDAKFRHNKAQYNEFIGELHSCHIIGFTQDPRFFGSIFFVPKKSGRLRMVTDPPDLSIRGAGRHHTCLWVAPLLGRACVFLEARRCTWA